MSFPKDFDQWRTGFLAKLTLQSAFGSIQSLDVTVGDNEALMNSLLHACFDAHRWNESHDKALAQRQAWINSRSLIPSALTNIDALLGLLNEDSELCLEAFTVSSIYRDLSTDAPIEQLSMSLLSLRSGLVTMADSNDRSQWDIIRDHMIGPFIFVEKNLLDQKMVPRDIKRLGLIFALTYIFRFFTAPAESDRRPSYLKNGVLKMHGRMLREGVPYYALVATLANSVLGESLNERDVKDKLRDFLTEKKQGRIVREKEILWDGYSWPKTQA